MKPDRAICTALAVSIVFLALPGEGRSEPPAGFHGEILSVQMIDAQTGWAAGKLTHSVALLQTHDGGRSWRDISARPLRSKEPVLSSDASAAITFRFLDAKHGWAAYTEDLDGSGPTILFSTEDGERGWHHNSFKTSVGGITSIQFTDRTHGFILVESDAASGKANKATYRTTDGGHTWQTTSEASNDRNIGGSLPKHGFTEGMVFRNANDGWIAGSPRGDDTAFFFHTRDGGKSWQPQTFDPPQGFSGVYTASFHTPWFPGDKKANGVLSVSFIQHDPNREHGPGAR